MIMKKPDDPVRVCYMDTDVTIYSDDRAHADFPVSKKEKVDVVFADNSERMLTSRPAYRVSMRKKELGKLFTGIEKVMGQ